MLLTLFNNKLSFMKSFQVFVTVFKVVCCRFVVCGKGLTIFYSWHKILSIEYIKYIFTFPSAFDFITTHRFTGVNVTQWLSTVRVYKFKRRMLCIVVYGYRDAFNTYTVISHNFLLLLLKWCFFTLAFRHETIWRAAIDVLNLLFKLSVLFILTPANQS